MLFNRKFLLEILFDRKHHNIIQWDHEGVPGEFKILKPDELAQLWGNKKRNTKMTFESFKRSLRNYYRTAGAKTTSMISLSKVRGKRYNYKFDYIFFQG